MDDLLSSNPKFQELVAKSKASPRKPFASGERIPKIPHKGLTACGMLIVE